MADPHNVPYSADQVDDALGRVIGADSSPQAGSDKMVESQGIKTAVDALQSQIDALEARVTALENP